MYNNHSKVAAVEVDQSEILNDNDRKVIEDEEADSWVSFVEAHLEQEAPVDSNTVCTMPLGNGEFEETPYGKTSKYSKKIGKAIEGASAHRWTQLESYKESLEGAETYEDLLSLRPLKADPVMQTCLWGHWKEEQALFCCKLPKGFLPLSNLAVKQGLFFFPVAP